MAKIYLGIGSNRDPDVHIPLALRRLATLFGELICSGVYESDPVGCSGPVFHNLVVGFESELPLESLLACCREVEDQAGRVRDGNRDSPHTLDIDLLLQGNTVLQAGRVRIPREDITRHAFVLEPLAEIAPDEVHPLRGETYASLWQQFDSSLTRQNRIGNAPV